MTRMTTNEFYLFNLARFMNSLVLWQAMGHVNGGSLGRLKSDDDAYWVLDKSGIVAW